MAWTSTVTLQQSALMPEGLELCTVTLTRGDADVTLFAKFVEDEEEEETSDKEEDDSDSSDDSAPSDEPFVVCRVNRYCPSISLSVPSTSAMKFTLQTNTPASDGASPTVALLANVCEDEDDEDDEDDGDGDDYDSDLAQRILQRQAAYAALGNSSDEDEEDDHIGNRIEEVEDSNEDSNEDSSEESSSGEQENKQENKAVKEAQAAKAAQAAAQQVLPVDRKNKRQRIEATAEKEVKRSKAQSGAAGSGSSKKEEKKSGKTTTTTESSSLPVERKTLPNGVSYDVLKAGRSGKPAAPGRKIKCKYEGRLASSGKKFDAGVLEFVIGSGQMIPGFDSGVRGMLIGENRRVFIPSAQAYGRKKVSKIPPNSNLVFDITAINVN